MKRKVLCVFSLLFWLVLLCTIVSAHVEQWMTPTAEIREEKHGGADASIAADALFTDEAGAHLYAVTPGGGWESGMCVYEVTNPYRLADGRIWGLEPGMYIRYSAREVCPGEAVKLRENPYLYMDDTWAAVYPNGVPELPENLSVPAQTDTAMLIAAPGADYPFMEDRARSSLERSKDDAYYTQIPDSRVFSLNDLYRFSDALMLLAVLVTVILFSISVWWSCCVLSRDCKKNRRALFIHGGAAVLLFVGILFVIEQIDLPSSLLPMEYITDFSHYTAQFELLLPALHALAEQGGAAAGKAVRYAESLMLFAAAIVLAGVLLTAGKMIWTSVRKRDISLVRMN